MPLTTAMQEQHCFDALQAISASIFSFLHLANRENQELAQSRLDTETTPNKISYLYKALHTMRNILTSSSFDLANKTSKASGIWFGAEKATAEGFIIPAFCQAISLIVGPNTWV